MLLRKLRTVLRLLPSFARFTLNAVWAIPAVLILRGVRPWVRVCMGSLIASRIGHFVGDATLCLAHQSLRSQSPRTVDWLWFPSRTSNAQWARMVRRQLFVRWWVKYLVAYSRLIPGDALHRLPATHDTRDIHGILQRSSRRFEFSSDERATAMAWLRRKGWCDADPFVCLMVRDSAYLSRHPMHADGGTGRWSYHDYRDSDIDTYVEAVQALVDRDYWVIRMGKVAQKRLAVNHPTVIDYPFVADQDDLMDIWLSSHCKFFVSTGTGIDMIPVVYGIPVVFVNIVPVGNVCSFAHSISVPKPLRWSETGRLLTPSEMLDQYHFMTGDFQKAGIVVEDLSPAAITSAVLEMEGRLTGSWQDAPEDLALQQRAWSCIRGWAGFADHHKYIHPESRLGADWVRSQAEALSA